MSQLMAQRSAAAKTTISPSFGTSKIYYANRNEPARAIEFKERTVATSYFLTNINQYFNIPGEFTFVEVESNTDQLGMRHHLMQEYYKGIPLEGMMYRVHERNGFITSANGRAVRNVNLDTHITLNEKDAFYRAKQYLNTKDTTVRQGKKVIVSKNFTFMPESFSIAFQFDIDVSFIERWRISIDALNGQLINKVSLVNTCFKEEVPPLLPFSTGTGLSSYYGNKPFKIEKFSDGSSRMVGQTNNGVSIATYDFRNKPAIELAWGISYGFDFYSSDTTYNGSYYKTAVSVQWGIEQAYEYYLEKHNRNSFNNEGAAIRSHVHVGNNYNNAFWTGSELGFGDGSNNNPLVELDVVSHELTHGVTQYEAGLQYYRESGALNESFSDIMGKAIEFSVFGDTATWLLSKHFRDGGLRDFSNPNLQDQPDTYQGDLWFTGDEDNGGVHYNSGVQNFWFYLLCEGGSGVNDNQLNYSVKAIGIDTAANIAYRNLTEYLTYSSDYFDSRVGSLLATADLYGRNSVAYQEVDKAWDAVGVINEPIITSALELYDITATTVKIKASLQPRGDTVTYHFEYGTTPAFGRSSSIYIYTDKVEGIVTGLQSETKYYLRLVATNENGKTYSAATEFTTISLAPLVKIKNAIDVTETSAILRGQINPNSLSTSFYFEYGLTPALGLVTQSYPIPDTTEFLNVSVPIINLQSRQTYYYRLKATNAFASPATESLHFFTAVKPVITSYTPLTAPTGTEVTITGQNFNLISEKNLVNFGATRGTVLSSSSTEIKVTVPTGASLAPISLLDAESGLTTESLLEFVPTFTGEFKNNSLQRTMGSHDYIYQTLVQDMDGDNKPDIVARHYLGLSVFINVNQGGDVTDESFIRSTLPSEYTMGVISLIDFDGNGLKDIVGRYQDQIRIYPNLSVPGYIFFGPPVKLTIPYLQGIAFGDFNIDGHVDIAGTHYLQQGDSSMILILQNQNPKGYLSPDNFVLRNTTVLPYYVFNLYSDDLNNDGKPDLIAAVYDQNFIPILKNKSHDSTFEFEENKVDDPTTERFPYYISQDLNKDGWRDIASHSDDQIGNVTILENQGVSENINMSNSIVAQSDTESYPQSGDIDGDGNVDLLVGTNDGAFTILRNRNTAGEHLSDSSFEKFQSYGTPNSSVSQQSSMTISDLNGDGRPEIINTYYYNSWPLNGYMMEIWQNGPVNCLDPSLIKVESSNYTATIVLPPNTTLDDFEIEYAPSGASYWWQVYSTTLSLYSGYSYQFRARAKCYLGFTDFHYINFAPDCVNTDYFSIVNIGSDNVLVTTNYDYEVQYSVAGTDQWLILPLYSNQITGLLPGTTYDLRIRGNCTNRVEFKYRQFTTICPQFSNIYVINLVYNKAEVRWSTNYAGNVVLEYSADNVNWILIDESLTMSPLIPAKQYFVRGKMVCSDSNSDFKYTSFTTPCPKVSMLSVSMITPFSARIDWLDESNTSNYIVSYSLKSGGSLTTVETSSTFLNLDGLKVGAEYFVKVAPQCTNEKNFISTTFNTVCYVPFDFLANEITHTSAELSWSDNFSGLPYFIDYTLSGSGVWKTSETALPSFSLSELRPGTQYEARVHITCLNETAPYVSLIFETKLYEETTFFPNPTDGKVTIHPSKNLIGKHYSIHDNTGRKVADAELLNYTIDLTYFAAGLYTLKIEGERIIKIVRQ